jgi:hypothetical protein
MNPMLDEDWDGWDHSEVVDLDVTGDPQLDQFGYQSPRRNFSPPPSQSFDWLAQAKADYEARQRRRAAVQANQDETRRRVAERQRGATVAGRPQSEAREQQLAPRVAQAVERGAQGRAPGWWKVDVTPDGRATWTRVDQPGDNGPRVTVQQTPAPQPRPQWHPVELTEPSLGTQVW